MGSPEQRRIALAGMLLLSLMIWGYDHVFPEKPQQNNEIQAGRLPKPQQIEKSQAALPIVSDSNVLHIDTLPSPFALLPTVSKEGIYTGNASPLGVPPIPNIDFPQIASNNPSYLQVKAILYRPDKANVAILDDGTGDTMVVEGSQSPWGYVSSITANKVVVKGEVLLLSHTGEI